MTLVRLLARPMLASMFIVGGYNAYRNAESMAKKAEPVTEKIVPAAQKAARKVSPTATIPTESVTLVKVNAITHMTAGALLATGKFPRLSANVLAATLVPTTVAGHPFWEEQDRHARANQMVHFFKNVSMIGGLLIAGVDTEGKPGLAWRTKNVARVARRQARHAKREAKLVGKGAKAKADIPFL